MISPCRPALRQPAYRTRSEQLGLCLDECDPPSSRPRDPGVPRAFSGAPAQGPARFFYQFVSVRGLQGDLRARREALRIITSRLWDPRAPSSGSWNRGFFSSTNLAPGASRGRLREPPPRARQGFCISLRSSPRPPGSPGGRVGPLRIITSRWWGFRICQFYCFALQVFLFPGATCSRAGDPSRLPPSLLRHGLRASRAAAWLGRSEGHPGANRGEAAAGLHAPRSAGARYPEQMILVTGVDVAGPAKFGRSKGHPASHRGEAPGGPRYGGLTSPRSAGCVTTSNRGR